MYQTPNPNGNVPPGAQQNGMYAGGHPNGYAPNGYNPNGYNPNGYNPNGYAPNGYNPGGYNQPGGYRPVGQLDTTRGLLKYILLSLITCGIYGIIAMSSVSNDINIAASRYDGRRTMHYCLLFFVVAPVTCGIANLVWYHNISDRIGCELRRRRIPYVFGASDFWLWNILGSLILVGPFIYAHKMFKAMNYICHDYNMRG